MANDSVISRPTKIKTPLQELEVIAAFVDTTSYEIMKRAARRYTENLKNAAFALDSTDPKLREKFAQYSERAIGVAGFLRILEEAAKEYKKQEGDI